MCNLSWTPPPTLRDHTSSWTTLEIISLKTFVCYPVNMMCSKSNQIKLKYWSLHRVLPPTIFVSELSHAVMCLQFRSSHVSIRLFNIWLVLLDVSLYSLVVNCLKNNVSFVLLLYSPLVKFQYSLGHIKGQQ